MAKKKKYFSHKTAIVEQPADIGHKTKIWHFSHIMPGVKIGKQCNIGQNVYIGSQAVIGHYVKIQNNVSVYDGVILEDYVFCGPSMVFTNDMNPRAKYPKKPASYHKTHVKQGATIGANATIVCGTVIGRHAFIGAGSVVTKDIPDHALVYGNPARLHGWICECGEKIDFKNKKQIICPKCQRKYKKINNNKIERINK